MRANRLLITTMFTLGCSLAAAAQVQVFAWQENRPEGVWYHYRVVNGGAEGLLSFTIGDDELSGGGAQLTVYPLGFVADDAGEQFAIEHIGFPIPAASVNVPAQWEASLILPEATTNAALHFSMLDGGTPIRSGTKRGFSVLVPRADDAYMTGAWNAILERGIRVHGRLQKDTIDAPTITAN